jgi:hypothetical protein
VPLELDCKDPHVADRLRSPSPGGLNLPHLRAIMNASEERVLEQYGRADDCRARRELNKADGHPLPPDAEDQERRDSRLKEFQKFVATRISIHDFGVFRTNLTWHNNTPVVVFRINERIFRVRELQGKPAQLKKPKQYTWAAKSWYEAVIVDGEDEKPLLEVDGNDPQLANRLLVAMADLASHP